jgi:hypothetical protein
VHHRSGRLATFAGVLILSVLSCASTAVAAAPRIIVTSPHTWQVVQRGRSGTANLVVTGRCRGVRGGLLISWGERRARVRCDPSGRFTARLADAPAGQHTLVVRSARRPQVLCRRFRVGVGDIYVIAGQSNASGRSALRFSYSNPTLRAAMFGNDYRWHDLRDPVDSPVRQVDRVSRDVLAAGSVWPDVATELLAQEGVPVAFVPCARGSTGIALWQADVRGDGPAGTLFTSMARRIRRVGGKVRAVLFWQGERNARARTSGEVYETQLRRLASAVWRRFEAPMVVAQIGDFGSNYPAAGVDAVRLAQERAWTADHIVQGAVLYDIDLKGQVHFTEASMVKAAAHRWAAAILGGVLGHDAGTTPRLVLAELVGDQVTLTTDSELAPAATLGGFVVRVDGQQVPIDHASTDGVSVTLTLGEPPAGPCTVSLGAGRSGAGAHVPTDTSAWRLPMLPFVERAVTTAYPDPASALARARRSGPSPTGRNGVSPRRRG